MLLMVWNIQQFGATKFNNTQVRTCIMSTIFPPGGVAPDILAVIEVLAKPAGLAEIINNRSGATATGMLLALLQAQNAGWNVVPPIGLCTGGRTEAISVFYRSDRLRFTGPHAWSNYGPLPLAQLPPNAPTPPWNALFVGAPPAAVGYPAPWNVAPFNVAGAVAPQVDFLDMAGAFVEFPLAGYRRPLRATFDNLTGVGPAALDLWLVHPSPTWTALGNSARLAMNALANVADIRAAPPMGTLRVIAGDTNVNAVAGAFAAFTGRGYAVQVATSTLYEQAAPAINRYLTTLSLDNFITQGAPVAADVVDRVMGAPPPVGTDMGTAPGVIAAMAPGARRTQKFRSWANFGHIGNRPKRINMKGVHGASDHLPIVLDF